VVENKATRKELAFIDKVVDDMSKGKIHRVSERLEKKRAALMLGLSLGWDVADTFEDEGSLEELGVSKNDVYQAVKLAESKRRWLGKKKPREVNQGQAQIQTQQQGNQIPGNPVPAAMLLQGGGRMHRGPQPGDTCNRCGAQGHWANSCPLPRIRNSYPPSRQAIPPSPRMGGWEDGK
jgi:hypothetical protein